MNDVPITVREARKFSAWADANWQADERAAFIDFLAYRPLAGAVIRGTGGVRKVRWSMPGRGKSGGARVIYYYHNAGYPLTVLWAYAKSERADLSPAEKAEWRLVVELIKVAARNRT